MDLISAQFFSEILNRSDLKLLESNLDGPKVFETPAGEIIKVFYYPRKKWLSSNHHYPYALRFCDNAKKLLELGFIAPQVSKMQYCKELRSYLIYYPKIPGENANKLATQNPNLTLAAVTQFIAALHAKGVVFRAIHLSNLLYQSDGNFALIDIADVKIKNKSLSTYMRYRNLKHLFVYKKDHQFWKLFGMKNFFAAYFSAPSVPYLAKKILPSLLIRFTARKFNFEN